MKKYQSGALLLALAFLLQATTIWAQNSQQNTWSVTKKKTFHKTYALGSETVELKNQFGKMDIKTWDKKEVQVDATITIGAMEEAYATKFLDAINIIDEKTADAIRFTTQIGEKGKGWSSDQSSEMHIDYIVYLPASAKLNATNSFGEMMVGDFSGAATFNSRHGSFTAGKLSNIQNLNVDFGKAKIGQLGNTNIAFKHSRIDIEAVTGDLKGEIDFCNSIDLPISASTKNIDLKNNHTSLYLMVPKNLSADYDIQTNNSTATGKGDITLTEEQTAASNTRVHYQPNHRYSGKLGNGGNTKITIKSNFGNVRLM